jgi:hypothetical protein
MRKTANATALREIQAPRDAPAEPEACPAAGANHLTQLELARRWCLSTATIERWRSEGIGPRFLKLGGQVRYRLDDILAYEASCLRSSTSSSA